MTVLILPKSRGRLYFQKRKQRIRHLCGEGSIKEVFDCVVNLIELGSVKRDMYQTALQLFLQLMNNPNLMVHEDELYELELEKFSPRSFVIPLA